MGQGLWGRTSVTQPADFTPWTFKAYCAEPDNWKVRLMDWSTGIRYGARILPGIVQVNVNLISTLVDCNELSRMRADLGSIPPPKPKYYMKEAVVAHELVHVRNFKSDFQKAFGTMKTAIERLSFPVSSYGTDGASVRGQLRNSQDIQRIAGRFQSAYLRSIQFEANHWRTGYDDAALAAMRPYRSMVSQMINARCSGSEDS